MDIVERLREIDQSHRNDPTQAKLIDIPDEHFTICGEAAEEIHRLRRALIDIQEAPEHYPAGYFKQRAMFALVN